MSYEIIVERRSVRCGEGQRPSRVRSPKGPIHGRRNCFQCGVIQALIAKVEGRSNASVLAVSVIQCWEPDSHERARAARITSRKPNRPRTQLAVTTAPINAPMIPRKATSLPVRYKFWIIVRGPSHAFPYLSGVAG